MYRYAIINGTTVEQVMLAAPAPTIPNRTVVELAPDQVVRAGDAYQGGVFTPRPSTPRELEIEEAQSRMVQALSLFRAWANDAKTAEELAAMTAAERVQRQAVIENRIAALTRACLVLIRIRGIDD